MASNAAVPMQLDAAPPAATAPVAAAASSSSISSSAAAASATQARLLTLPDGSIYVGEYRNKPHGRGYMKCKGGTEYSGEWKNGQRHGIGSQRSADGSVHDGQWEAGLIHGLGARWDIAGKLIECGRWIDDELAVPRAVPLRCFPDGEFLSAAALQAKRDHPHDSALLPDGSHYIGSLNADGLPHGQGASFSSDGSPEVTLLVDAEDESQSGRWVDGKLQGRVSHALPSGDRYEGSFKDSQYEGVGVCSWKDGQRYEGEFVAGKCNGLGALWDKDGKLAHCGRWEDDEFAEDCAVPLGLIPAGKYLSASAKRTHPNGLTDVGFFIGSVDDDDQPHGQGASFQPDGSAHVTLLIDAVNASKSGCWIDGQLHGLATQLHPNGESYQGSFSNGRRHGLGVDISRKYSLLRRYEGEFVEGERHGFGAEWTEDGCLLRCG